MRLNLVKRLVCDSNYHVFKAIGKDIKKSITQTFMKKRVFSSFLHLLSVLSLDSKIDFIETLAFIQSLRFPTVYLLAFLN